MARRPPRGGGMFGPLTRRGFLGAAAAGAAGVAAAPLFAEPPDAEAALRERVAKLSYLTPPEEFRTFGREKPHVDELPADKLRQVGLDRDTWSLEVIADPDSDSRLEAPLSNERGTALSWEGLMRLAEKRTVRFLKVMSCTNMDEPLGMGLWEGVPLRDVIWLARPAGNVRRVYYYGFHNDEPAQRFQGSLAIDRVLEDPPGELPVILCYKLNGAWLTPKLGGPVRCIVPESYGNRCVKWLKRVLLTNSFQANDTYAGWNNDVESPLKTYARFLNPQALASAGQPLSLLGFAHVGMSGLSGVQYAVVPRQAPPPPDDPYLASLDWKDARILPPPDSWGGGLPGGTLPPVPLQFDPATGKPRTWPVRYAIAYFTAIVGALPPGAYDLRCRSIDANGVAQPLPRLLPKSGNNAMQKVPLVVEA